MSYVTGSHSAKVGFNLMHQWRFVTQEPNNSFDLTLNNGAPFSITEYATPINFHETVNYNAGIYAQDQWTIKRLTLNYGVRIDFLKASVDPQDLAAGPFTAARSFAGIDNVPNWKDVDPRIGAAYDLFGNGKTAIKGSIGRYVVADGYTIARALNPVQSTVNNTTRTWLSDPAGQLDPRLDCNLQNPAANGSCGALASPAFGGTPVFTTSYDPSIVTGWGVRPYNWESQLSIQQQVAPRVSVYLGYSRRWFGNFFATQNTAVTNASYTPFCVNVPTGPSVTGVSLPGAGGQQCGFFDLIRPTTAISVIQKADNFGKVQDVYDGIDFDANARLAKGILVNGGVSWGRERFNICDFEGNLQITSVGVGNLGTTTPHTNAYCDVRPPFQPNIKGQLTYPFPWGIGASISFQSLPGAQINANYPLTNTTPGLTLGRTFSSVAPTVSMVQPGLLYLDRIYQTDVRFTKSIRYGRTVIRPTVSVFNLFNANPTNTNNAFQATYGTSWLAPTVIMTPRFVDFGVQVTF